MLDSVSDIIHRGTGHVCLIRAFRGEIRALRISRSKSEARAKEYSLRNPSEIDAEVIGIRETGTGDLFLIPPNVGHLASDDRSYTYTFHSLRFILFSNTTPALLISPVHTARLADCLVNRRSYPAPGNAKNTQRTFNVRSECQPLMIMTTQR